MMYRINTPCSVVFLLFLVLPLIGCGGGGSGSSVSTPVGPVITGIQPPSGGPGTLVTLTGTGFGSIQGASTLSYNGVTVQPSTWADNLITITIPSTATGDGGTFIVMVGGHVSAPSTQFTVSAPLVYSINPSQGHPGTQVTLSGNYFGAQQGSSYVAFNGQQAQIISWHTTQIVCIVPTGTSISGAVSVTVNINGTAATGTQQFNLALPSISSIIPTIGNIGAEITIVGQGFGASQSGQGQVTIGGAYVSILSWSDTTLRVKIPSGLSAGVQNVVVLVNGLTSPSGTVTVAAPVLNYCNPLQPSYETTFTLYGQYFGQTKTEGNSQVQITGETSSVNSVSSIVWSDTSLSFKWPITNKLLGTQEVTIRVTVGGLSSEYRLTAD